MRSHITKLSREMLLRGDGTPYSTLQKLIEAVLIQEADENLPAGIKNADVVMLSMRLADQVRRWYAQRVP